MSVIYDQLKQVEQTQAEDPPAVKAEESLPLEEEIQQQQQEKWYSLKGHLVKGGSIFLILLSTIGFFVFISGRKPHPPKETRPSALPPLKQTVAKPPAVAPAAKKVVSSTPPPNLSGRSATKTEAKKEKVAKSRGSKPAVPVASVGGTNPKAEKIKPPKVDPAMLAKTKKSLPSIQAGQQFYQAGALDQAVQAYKKALQEDPKQLEAHNNLGVIYTRKGWLKAAAKNFREALTTNPYYAEAHYNLAVVLEKKGNNKQALGHYLKFIEYARPKHQERVKKVERHINFD